MLTYLWLISSVKNPLLIMFIKTWKGTWSSWFYQQQFCFGDACLYKEVSFMNSFRVENSLHEVHKNYWPKKYGNKQLTQNAKLFQATSSILQQWYCCLLQEIVMLTFIPSLCQFSCCFMSNWTSIGFPSFLSFFTKHKRTCWFWPSYDNCTSIRENMFL